MGRWKWQMETVTSKHLVSAAETVRCVCNTPVSAGPLQQQPESMGRPLETNMQSQLVTGWQVSRSFALSFLTGQQAIFSRLNYKCLLWAKCYGYIATAKKESIQVSLENQSTKKNINMIQALTGEGREHRRTDLGKTSQGRKYWSGMKDKYSLTVQKVELKGVFCRAKNE